MRLHTFCAVTALAVLAAPATHAQDLLARWLAPRPVLTTGLSNVVHDLPLLDPGDDDAPMTFGAMRSLARDADGAFALRPGAWELTVESFCLYAGTAGPSKGDGYLFAPLAGPKSAIISGILDRAWKFPAIPQHDIQSLLWAILSHARFSELAPDLQSAAAQLLTKAEIASLEVDASDRISDAIREQVMARLPPAAAKVFDAESRLRDAFATGASYEEQAKLAVLDDDPDPEKGDREIPNGRWSLVGNSLMRFSASDYTKATIQVMVPEPVDVVYDAKRRITALRSADGWATEAIYDDTIKPLVIPGEPDFKGYAFKRVTATQPVNGKLETFSVDNAGWTFAGHFTGKGKLPDDGAPELAAWFSGPSAVAAMRDRDFDDRYSNWQQNYKDAKRSWDRAQPPSQKDVDKVTDPSHYAKGAKAALGADPAAKASWLEDHFNRLGRAAAYIACRLEGGCDPDAPGGKKFKPGGAMVPGAQGSQRLGLSGR